MTPFCAARMITGSASFRAASARARSPAATASSTLPTALRRRERRDLLISVRRAAWRAAFWADLVLAIGLVSMSFLASLACDVLKGAGARGRRQFGAAYRGGSPQSKVALKPPVLPALRHTQPRQPQHRRPQRRQAAA